MDEDQRTQAAEEAAIEDARLVSVVLDGDATAYDDLVRRYQRRAVAVAYRLLGNSHDAADVAQDAFLRGFKGLSSLADHRRFGPWLMRIVSNLSLNYRRSRQTGVARRAVALDDVIEGPDEFRSTTGQAKGGGVSPVAHALSGELQGKVGEAIDRLPEKQRLALILYSIEGLPQKQVADIMECSVELVKWNVFQARKTLKKDLADYLG